ncbi:uncharacterized protein LOC143199897 [Rhynchophorus ferrugineus]|uniref:uncharacterized protein LOC143199897 n=1 Tax=Rhynchophorus ferrugineus TaxID=354439 RepID=UPI003FCDC254
MGLAPNVGFVLIYLSLCSSLDIYDYNSTILSQVMSMPWIKYLVVVHGNYNETDSFIKSLKSRKAMYIINIENLVDYPEESGDLFSEYNLYIFLNSLQANIEEFESVLKTSLYRQRNRYLMLTRMITRDVMVTISKKWFKKYFMVNLVFMDLSLDKIYRYNPFAGVLLQGTDTGLICEDFCHNLHGFSLKISIFPHFVAVWKDDHYEGRDGFLVLEVLKHINASAEYIKPPPRTFYGFKYRNGTITGQLHQLITGSAHGAFNTGPITPQNYYLIDHTITHDFDKITILLTKQTPTIRNVASVMPCIMWIVTCLYLLVHSLYLKIFVGYTWPETFIINIRLLVGDGIANIPSRYSKIVAMALVFYCYIVDSYFQSKLMSVLSVPKPTKKLETIQEVAESDYRFNTENLILFPIYNLEGPDMHHIRIIQKRNRVLDHREYLAKAATCPPKEGFLSAQYLNTFYFSTMMQEYHIKEKCFYAVNQVLATNWLSFRLKKGSPFLNKVNRVVLGISEAGIRQHWDSVMFHSIPEETSKGSHKLTVDTLLFCFYFLFLCLGLSFIVFTLEILISKRAKKS